jgi:hypothetical protein
MFALLQPLLFPLLLLLLPLLLLLLLLLCKRMCTLTFAAIFTGSNVHAARRVKASTGLLPDESTKPREEPEERSTNTPTVGCTVGRTVGCLLFESMLGRRGSGGVL